MVVAESTPGALDNIVAYWIATEGFVCNPNQTFKCYTVLYVVC